MTYNGWTNWETWNCNLHFFDGQTATDVGYPTRITGEDCRNIVDEFVDNYSLPPFIGDMIASYMGAVNWDEIASHLNEDVED